MSDIEHKDLWDALAADPDSTDAMCALVEAWMPMVHSVLDRVVVHLPPGFQVEDLLQSAVLGLYGSIERFDPKQNVSFRTFSYRRIKGAVLDELRNKDHMTRSMRSKYKKIQSAIEDWINSKGTAPSEEELCEYIGMTRSEMDSIMEHARPWLSLNQVIVAGSDGNDVLLQDILSDPVSISPAMEAVRQDVFKYLRTSFRGLSSREQKVLHLYYFEDLRLCEIAEIFELTEARICQIHGMAIAKLKAMMNSSGCYGMKTAI